MARQTQKHTPVNICTDCQMRHGCLIAIDGGACSGGTCSKYFKDHRAQGICAAHEDAIIEDLTRAALCTEEDAVCERVFTFRDDYCDFCAGRD